jgi:hypothetical protein
MNNHGIMVGSVLTISIVEARELKSQRITGGINAYVVAIVED